jgi:hypothetical protein
MWQERVEKRGACMGNPKERGYLEEVGVYGRMIIKLIFRNGMVIWIGFMWLRIWRVASSGGYSNKLRVSIKYREFRDSLRIF